ncbi:hypothetical protein Tco_0163697, partial [Tanacetum coccineum]
MSYSGLNEFKELEFKGYGTENNKQESNIVCDKKSDDSKKSSIDSLVKEQVSKDTSSFVESSLNVDKETVFPKNHEKPVRHQELTSAEQTVTGKDFLNPLIVDSLLKTIWFINAPCFCNEALAIPGQTATEVEEENARVEYDFDLTEQQVTPLKAPQVEVQSQETFKAELRVLNAAKILAEAYKERDIQDTDEEQTKALEQQKQERANLEAALKLQKQFDQERKEADNIDWNKIIEQVQERQSGSMIRYQALKKKPVTVAQARKNMMVYLKNMANYKMSYFKGTEAYQSFEDMLKAFEIRSDPYLKKNTR